jgi:hypothetical protein
MGDFLLSRLQNAVLQVRNRAVGSQHFDELCALMPLPDVSKST